MDIIDLNGDNLSIISQEFRNTEKAGSKVLTLLGNKYLVSSKMIRTYADWTMRSSEVVRKTGSPVNFFNNSPYLIRNDTPSSKLIGLLA